MDRGAGERTYWIYAKGKLVMNTKKVKLDRQDRKKSFNLDNFLSSNPIFSLLGIPIIFVYVVGFLFAAGGIWVLLGMAALVITIPVSGGIISFATRVRAKTSTDSPGSFLLSVIHVFPEKQRNFLEQEISDMRLEFYEALAENNRRRARCIILGYYLGLSWSALRWGAEYAKKLVGFMPKVN